MRREDNHTKEEDDSVRNLFSVFFQEFIYKVLVLKVSNLWPSTLLNSYNEMKIEIVRFLVDPLPRSLSLRNVVAK